jgi:hypothetical protein
MEPEGSIRRSQEPSTGPYPEPDQFSPHKKNCLSLRIPSWHFVTTLFFKVRKLLAPRQTPKLEDQPYWLSAIAYSMLLLLVISMQVATFKFRFRSQIYRLTSYKNNYDDV